MFRSMTAKVLGFTVAVGASAALVGTAASSTGAYFSDSRSGGVTGSIGSIKVVTSGGSGTDGLDFNFANMLPGEAQTANVAYQNTGHNKQDVWLVFPNADALHAINDLGSFGEVHITSNGHEVFGSTNLNDNTSGTCPGCPALPAAIKLAENVTPGSVGHFTFSFNYGADLKSPLADGVPFNCYPVTPAACAHNGLPYQVVATQHGISWDNAHNTPGNLGH